MKIIRLSNRKAKMHLTTPGFNADRENIANQVDFSVLGNHLRPVIEESLKECGKNNSRKGTFMTPFFTFYTVLFLCICRDLSQHKVINMLISTFRWLLCSLPARIIADGALTHARMRLGASVFRLVFRKISEKDGILHLPADFHGHSTVIFDGTTASMPDTEENRETFGRPSVSGGGAVSRMKTDSAAETASMPENAENSELSGKSATQTGFPQMRIVALLSLSLRKVIGISYASYIGKGTGERNLMRQILMNLKSSTTILCLLDAGFYAFELFKDFNSYGHMFIVKAPRNIKLERFKTHDFSDGSYLATIKKNSSFLVVRVIPYRIRGFRDSKLITNIFDANITALEFSRHYHQHWDIEIGFDEIKTHQCAVLKGHAATIFRSKIPELVIQELYAMLIVYNSVRDMMCEAAEIHNKDPLKLSFSDTFQFIKDAFNYFNTDKGP